MEQSAHIARKIGQALASEFDESLRRPIGWDIIDALARLDEAVDRNAAVRPVSPPAAKL